LNLGLYTSKKIKSKRIQSSKPIRSLLLTYTLLKPHPSYLRLRDISRSFERNSASAEMPWHFLSASRLTMNVAVHDHACTASDHTHT
jgi:hypothetical protein